MRNKTMLKHKVIVGIHIGADPTGKSGPRNEVTGKWPSRTYKQGEVVYTEGVNLAEKHGEDKLQFLGDDSSTRKGKPVVARAAPPVPQSTEPVEDEDEFDDDEDGEPTAVPVKPLAVKPSTPAHAKVDDKGLNAFLARATEAQLKAYAEEEEIDLKGAKTRAEMVKVIKASR